MDPQFGVEVEHRDDTTEVRLRGELDLVTREAAWEQLEPVLDARSVVLDIRNVSFMDSTGINLIARAAQTLADASRVLTIRARVDQQALRVLKVANLGDLFTLEVDEAS